MGLHLIHGIPVFKISNVIVHKLKLNNVDRSLLIVILISSLFVIVATMEFLMWNVGLYSNLKSISDSTAIILTGLGLTITFLIYLYVRKKGWWNVNSRYT